jgi:hypothetical protein
VRGDRLAGGTIRTRARPHARPARAPPLPKVRAACSSRPSPTPNGLWAEAAGPASRDEAEVFRRPADWLVRVTRHRLRRSGALAEDACAHAWLELCRSEPERTQNLLGWLRVVALHEGVGAPAPGRARAPRRGRLESGPRGGGPPTARPAAEGAEAPVGVELAVEAREALRGLTALRRAAPACSHSGPRATATRRSRPGSV